MAQQFIGVGATANDRAGDPLRDAFIKINENTTELFSGDTSGFFQWSFVDQISLADPGIANFCFDNVDPASADNICISDIARTGIDIQSGASLVQENSSLVIKKFGSIDTYIVIRIETGGAVDDTGFFTAPILVVESKGTFVEGDIFDFSFDRQPEIQEVIKVNSLAELPTPDGSGFIELGGRIVTYVFRAGVVDISPFKIKITGGVVVLRGLNRFTSTLTSDTTGPLLTISGAFYADEFMNFDNPNGDIYDYDADGLAQAAFVSQNAVIRDCKSVGSVTDANTISLRVMTVVTTSVGGISVFGTGKLQFNISQMLGFDWTGTLIDLGTSTWDIINWGNNNRWISPAGATIISGATGSANLTSNGRALVAGNLFNGAGTALSGITTQDLKWSFHDNVFVDGVTQDTRVAVNSFLDGTAQTVDTSTAGAGVYILMDQNGTDWDSNKTLKFTQAANGIVTYIGLDNIDVYINAFSTVEKSGGGSDNICTKLAIDTGSGFVVQDETIGCTQNSTPTQITSAGFFTLSTDDDIAIFAANVTSAVDIIASQATLLVNEIM